MHPSIHPCIHPSTWGAEAGAHAIARGTDTAGPSCPNAKPGHAIPPPPSHLNLTPIALVSSSQGALILKILRGKFPPVTGYSPDISDLIKRCLTQVRGETGCDRGQWGIGSASHR